MLSIMLNKTSALSYKFFTVPTPDHVVILMVENYEYNDIIGNTNAPYWVMVNKQVRLNFSAPFDLVSKYKSLHKKPEAKQRGFTIKQYRSCIMSSLYNFVENYTIYNVNFYDKRYFCIRFIKN